MIEDIKNCIQTIQNYPKEGVTFRHIAPLFANNLLFEESIKLLFAKISDTSFDYVAGLDARGFIIATAISIMFKKPQVMIRKKNKLPKECYSVSYGKEYGQDILELEKDSVRAGTKVLIVDDLIATAGTLMAAADLINQAGATVSAFACVIELNELGGRGVIRKKYPNIPVYSLLEYGSERPVVQESQADQADQADQGLNAIKLSRPLKYDPSDSSPVGPVLMWHKSLESMANRFLEITNFRPSYIHWDFFPDGWPNITFENSKTLVDKDLYFLMNMSRKEIFAEQLSLLIAMPRQLIRSLTILIPYLGPATHERVDYSGMLATVEPILKAITEPIPQTKTAQAKLQIIDIHALPIRFYGSDNCVTKITSAIPALKKLIEFEPDVVIAFPDDGAHKRFKYSFECNRMIVCSKVRIEETRKIVIKDYYNWPKNKKVLEKCYERVIIVDDLVQSGSTIIECAKALKAVGFKTVEAFVVHAVFPKESWRKFVDSESVDTFYVCNTNPEVTDGLVGVRPFKVLEVEKIIAESYRDLKISNNFNVLESKKKIFNVYVASENEDKLEAVRKGIDNYQEGIDLDNIIIKIHSVSGCSSDISEQPYGLDETLQGCLNRLNKAIKKVNGSMYDRKDPLQLFVSIENGIVDSPTLGLCDFPYIMVAYYDNNNEMQFYNNNYYINNLMVNIDAYKDLFDSVDRKTTTFGSVFEKEYGIPKGTWHKYVSGKSRIEIMSSGLSKLLMNNII
jgi:adenine phosphoribosyltransferase